VLQANHKSLALAGVISLQSLLNAHCLCVASKPQKPMGVISLQSLLNAHCLYVASKQSACSPTTKMHPKKGAIISQKSE
jgi:hypothetical protein